MLRLVLLAILAATAHADVTAFVGVNVLPMDTERVLLAQTVLVRDGVIAEIGNVDAVTVPNDARVIYGRGRWLLPGLIDMHVHIRPLDLPRYLENGITTVRDLAGLDSVLDTKRRVDAGEVPGPRIFVASRLLTGPNPQNPFFSSPVTRASDAPSAVAEQLARGSDSIKLYDGLSRETYDALVNAARARGVKIAGHVTQHVDVRHAMTMQDSIEHLSGYSIANASLRNELAAASRDSGVWNCPTLVVYTQHVTRDMAPDARARLLADRRAMVTALDVAGARILAGTDAGYLVPAGVALHDELDELRAAGLTPFEVLSAATRSAGQYLDQSVGVIAIQSRADLLLVETNPLENLRVLRRPAGVMVNGRWIPYEKRRAVR
jgi:imidazolonepropionase-like amidohydrolase